MMEAAGAITFALESHNPVFCFIGAKHPTSYRRLAEPQRALED
jgi:hypothetical protein